MQEDKQKQELDSAKINDIIITPFNTRVLVEEDKFRSGYECTKCDGTGIQQCFQCKGTMRYIDTKQNERDCQACTKGVVTCTQCNGRGATIEIPETAKRRPNTGIVRAIGDKVINRNLVGKRVLYSNFAGHHVDFAGPNNTRIIVCFLDEAELIGGLSSPLKTLDRSADFTTAQ